MKREENSDEEEERDEGGGEKRVGCSRLCEEEIKESKCTWEEGAWKRRISEIYSVFTRKTETETAENRCWLVLKVLERNAERLWTAPPAVKQDGGRHYVWRLGETGGGRDRGKPRARSSQWTEGYRVRKRVQPYLTKAEWVLGEGGTLGSTL